MKTVSIVIMLQSITQQINTKKMEIIKMYLILILQKLYELINYLL